MHRIASEYALIRDMFNSLVFVDIGSRKEVRSLLVCNSNQTAVRIMAGLIEMLNQCGIEYKKFGKNGISVGNNSQEVSVKE